VGGAHGQRVTNPATGLTHHWGVTRQEFPPNLRGTSCQAVEALPLCAPTGRQLQICNCKLRCGNAASLLLVRQSKKVTIRKILPKECHASVRAGSQ